MTKKEMIKKLQVKEADLWNAMNYWKALCTDEELETCTVYERKLRDWSRMNDVLEMLDVDSDYNLWK